MIRRSRTTISALLGAAMIAAFVAGCGTATTTAPVLSARSTVSPTVAVAASLGAPSAGASGSAASGSPFQSPTNDFSCGPHLDAKLEDLLPSIIGGVELEKCSMALSAYIASTSGGDDALYAPWLVKFGKIPDDVTLAVAVDLTGQENFIVHAIKVPGVADATLSSTFADVARKAGWPVETKTVATKTVLQMIDPTAAASGGLSVGYVFAKDSVLYTVITDDSSLLLEALIKLP